MTPDPRSLAPGPQSHADRLRMLVDEGFAPTRDHACILAGAAALDEAAPLLAERDRLLEGARQVLGAYARESLARSRWAAESNPDTHESRRLFEDVLARESETSYQVIELGRLVFPEETAALTEAP